MTWTPLPVGSHSEILLLILADIGATVTPWMLFFQQSAVVDKGMQPRDINAGRFDTVLGALLAAIFGVATILATAPLFRHGINAADFQGAQFAQALEFHGSGNAGVTLLRWAFSRRESSRPSGISTSSAYAFGEVFQTGYSLNRPIREAWPFDLDFARVLPASLLRLC